MTIGRRFTEIPLIEERAEQLELSQRPVSSARLRVGLALIAGSSMLLELLLARIFSVAAGYHCAFMIVSIAMFGMTLGALRTLAGKTQEAISKTLVRNAVLFFASLVVVSVVHNHCTEALLRINQFLWVAVSFVLFAIPFYFAGVCICLSLTRHRDVGWLYAFDLFGAAIGCLALVVGLSITNAQTMIAVAGLTAVVAAFCFAEGGKLAPIAGRLAIATAIGLTLLFCPGCLNETAVEEPAEYIKWNPIGRVVVSPFIAPAVTWARTAEPGTKPLAQKWLCIDYQTHSVMTDGKATPEQLQPLRHDITAIANAMRPNGSLFVIGAGAGRDVLTGIQFGQKTIDACELNPAVVTMLKGRYAVFTDHLVDKPGVNIFCDEARSWLASSQKTYDIIQSSMVASWSASSSGAFMLTENVLYTKEAFDLYLQHLKPDGILSC